MVNASSAHADRHVLINVVELRRRLGTRLDVDLAVRLPQLEVLTSRLVPDQIVEGQVTLDAIERGVSVSGSITFDWEGECRRCLEPVTGTVEADIDEIFQMGAEHDGDLIDFDGEIIDLLPIVRDVVLASLPLAPLCRSSCQGPDPDRYPAIPIDELEPEAPAPDPRWSALSDLDLGESE